MTKTRNTRIQTIMTSVYIIKPMFRILTLPVNMNYVNSLSIFGITCEVNKVKTFLQQTQMQI